MVNSLIALCTMFSKMDIKNRYDERQCKTYNRHFFWDQGFSGVVHWKVIKSKVF